MAHIHTHFKKYVFAALLLCAPSMLASAQSFQVDFDTLQTAVDVKTAPGYILEGGLTPLQTLGATTDTQVQPLAAACPPGMSDCGATASFSSAASSGGDEGGGGGNGNQNEGEGGQGGSGGHRGNGGSSAASRSSVHAGPPLDSETETPDAGTPDANTASSAAHRAQSSFGEQAPSFAGGMAGQVGSHPGTSRVGRASSEARIDDAGAGLSPVPGDPPGADGRPGSARKPWQPVAAVANGVSRFCGSESSGLLCMTAGEAAIGGRLAWMYRFQSLYSSIPAYESGSATLTGLMTGARPGFIRLSALVPPLFFRRRRKRRA